MKRGEIEWIGCGACGGTGVSEVVTIRHRDPTWASRDELMAAQGTCVACRGLGLRRLSEEGGK